MIILPMDLRCLHDSLKVVEVDPVPHVEACVIVDTLLLVISAV